MSYPVNVSLLCRNSIVREGLSRILAERDFRIVQSSSTFEGLRTGEGQEDEDEEAFVVLFLVASAVAAADVVGSGANFVFAPVVGESRLLRLLGI